MTMRKTQDGEEFDITVIQRKYLPWDDKQQAYIVWNYQFKISDDKNPRNGTLAFRDRNSPLYDNEDRLCLYHNEWLAVDGKFIFECGFAANYSNGLDQTQFTDIFTKTGDGTYCADWNVFQNYVFQYNDEDDNEVYELVLNKPDENVVQIPLNGTFEFTSREGKIIQVFENGICKNKSGPSITIDDMDVWTAESVSPFKKQFTAKNGELNWTKV